MKRIAFLSYSRFNDNHDDGLITRLKEKLQGEVRALGAGQFEIFQDVEMAWGNQWREVVEGKVKEACLFIPVITPSYFQSEYCRDELRLFLEWEREWDRSDLILPIYYITSAEIEDAASKDDECAEILKARMFVDFRDFRRYRLDWGLLPERLERMAAGILAVLKADGQLSLKASAVNDTAPVPEIIEEEALPEQLLVDSSGTERFTRLQQAVEEAEPGARLLIAKGVYKGTVVIEKPLELVGEHQGSVALSTDSGPVIICKSEGIRLIDLSIRQSHRFAQGRPPDTTGHAAVAVESGSCTMMGCTIQSECGEGVLVDDEATIEVRKCTLSKSYGQGLIAGRKTEVFVSDSTLEENTFGIDAAEESVLELVNCKVTRNTRSGIASRNARSIAVSNSEISQNSEHGLHDVSCQSARKPRPAKWIVTGSTITGNGSAGLCLEENTNYIITGCTISANGTFGVVLNGKGANEVRSNKVSGNKRDGIQVCDSGAEVTLVDNDIIENGESGVTIAYGERAFFNLNRIRDNNLNGVRIGQLSRLSGSQNGIKNNQAGDVRAPSHLADKINRAGGMD